MLSMRKAKNRSPKHKLTQSGRGWFKRIGPEVKWICSKAVAPTGTQADAIFEEKFADLCNPRPRAEIYDVNAVSELFLERKRISRDSGQLDERTYQDYADSLQLFNDTVGDDLPIDDLRPADFGKFKTTVARFGVHRRAKHIINVRSMFNWGHAMRFCAEPDYGPDFSPPSRAEFRKARAKRENDKGKRLYDVETIHKLIAWPHTWNMRAMILLALNAGFGNTDLAELNWRTINFDAYAYLKEPASAKKVAKIEYRRGKTGILRQVCLWPETVDALRLIRYPETTQRKPPEDGTVFLTRQGHRLINGRKDATANNFFKLCENVEVECHGFYSLRRTFRTIADATGDSRAIARIMGHEIGDVADIYVQDITFDRLERVTNHVREALRISDAMSAAQSADAQASADRSETAKLWRRRSRKKAIPAKRGAKTDTILR